MPGMPSDGRVVDQVTNCLAATDWYRAHGCPVIYSPQGVHQTPDLTLPASADFQYDFSFLGTIKLERVAVPEELVIADHFCIKPLLPLIDQAGSFWVLALSAGRTRLYQGSRWTFAEVTGLDLPQGLAEIWGETEYQEAHTVSGLKGSPPGISPQGLWST